MNELELREFQESLQQLGMVLRSCAPLFFSYFLVLKEQGFSAEEAMAMVCSLQDFILAQGEQ